MRATVIISAHNEGLSLQRTLESLMDSSTGVEFEIVVVDDGSTDDSLASLRQRFSRIQVVTLRDRMGTGPAKDIGAKEAEGETFLFLDAHTKPERGAVQRLIEQVERFQGEAILVPKVPALSIETWQNSRTQIGQGYRMDLINFQSRWQAPSELRPASEPYSGLFESPALIGCAFAISRQLYERLWGQDAHMRGWGVEDLDLGLKAWLMGASILVDPMATIGHRFQPRFGRYEVSLPQFVANQLRMARKNFSETTWATWVEMARGRYSQSTPEIPEGVWTRAWTLFEQQRPSVEEERQYLMGRRVRDEFWYARTFQLEWPVMEKLREEERPTRALESPAQPATSLVEIEHGRPIEKADLPKPLPFTVLTPSPPPPPPPTPGVQPTVTVGNYLTGTRPLASSLRRELPYQLTFFQMANPLFSVSKSGYSNPGFPSSVNLLLAQWGSQASEALVKFSGGSPLNNAASRGGAVFQNPASPVIGGAVVRNWSPPFKNLPDQPRVQAGTRGGASPQAGGSCGPRQGANTQNQFVVDPRFKEFHSAG